MCLDLISSTSSNLYVFIFRDRSGRYREKKSESISHLVVTVSETKGSRRVFIRIIEAALLVLALVFHYLGGMSVTSVLRAVIRNVVLFPGCGRELLFSGTSEILSHCSLSPHYMLPNEP